MKRSLAARVLDVVLRALLKPRLARIRNVSPAVLADSRRRFERNAKLLPPPPRGAEREAVDAHGVPCTWFRAPGVRDFCRHGALLYLHGGGYALGSPEPYRDLCVRFSALVRVPVLYVGYRLAPEHPFPAAICDAVAAWGWLQARGADPRACALAGDSAGGGLCIALMLALKRRGMPLPGAAALMSPWVDLTASGASVRANARTDAYLSPHLLGLAARAYLGDAEPRNPLASPLFGDLSGLPPIAVHFSESELLADDARRLGDAVSAAGGEAVVRGWAGLPHQFQVFAPVLPEARASLRALCAFLDRHLRPARTPA